MNSFCVSCLKDLDLGFTDFFGPDILYVKGDLNCRHITVPKIYVDGNVKCQDIICCCCYIGGSCSAETVIIYNDATFKGALNVYDFYIGEGDLFIAQYQDIFCVKKPFTVRGDIILL